MQWNNCVTAAPRRARERSSRSINVISLVILSPVSAIPAKATPVMRQWERLKTQYPDTLLLFRLGDFYEMFGEDARIAARECEIALTTRDKDKGEDSLPMCGVPFHAAERYISILISKGYRCAISEQMEDARYARGLVKREVVRVLSPGTVLEDSYLHGVGAATGNNFLAALSTDARVTRFGLALVDISTGEFLAGEVDAVGKPDDSCEPRLFESPDAYASANTGDATPEAADTAARFAKLREELLRFSPAEILIPERIRQCSGFAPMLEQLRLRSTAFDAGGFDGPREKLLKQFRVSSLRGFGLEEYPLAQEAAALILDYLRESHLGALGHLRRITLLSTEGWMVLDNATRRNLELAQSIRDGSAKGTLLELLDDTRTGAGSRLLRKWVLQPLLSTERIERRQEAVQEMRDNLLLRRDCRDLLKGTGDIERLVARAVAGTGNARDLAMLRSALLTMPALRSALEMVSSPALHTVRDNLAPPPDVVDLLRRAIADEPPLTISDGGIIRDGYDRELDELRSAARDSKSWILALEETERARSGIPTLKVGFNSVFGYYIEVTKLHIAKVPADYIRKQTTANAERYITEALKEREALILGGEDRMKELEKRLFESVRAQVAAAAHALQDTARALAHLDVYAGLAEVASRRDYVRPEIVDETALDIRSGRHPVVEAHLNVPFVPNDCVLDTETNQVIIITGPNASGKSTFLRQVALIVLMAQIGSFVPARSARIGLVDRIFTRVGAQDDLATGQSTFTVEMNETANILNNATPRSLVILDEVGRGTSTYDGLSIAWAVAEYLHELGPKTLFATHYHHLNELEERLPRTKNYRIAVKEDGDHIIFLRRIIRGGTDRSFGVQVARLAGLPEAVVSRARELLEIFSRERLRGTDEIQAPVKEAPAKKQVTASLFEEPKLAAEPHPALLALQALDVDNLTPLEAIVKLQELRKMSLG